MNAGLAQVPASTLRLSLARVLSLAPVVRAPHGELTLSVDGRIFLTELHCPHCRVPHRVVFRLSGRLRPGDRFCDRCGREREPSGLDRVERLSALLPLSVLRRPLASFGLRRGDVFTLATRDAETRFEIGPT